MKLAVLSDIHANLSALEAVLADACRRGAEKFLCLGDIVGYGPQPEECVRLIRRLSAVTVLGNHDAWAVCPVALSRLEVSPTVVPGLRHTRDCLMPSTRVWLRRRPYTAQAWGVAAVHGSFHRPEEWLYLTDAVAARTSFQWQRLRVAFFGHTHESGYWQEGGYRLITPPPGRKIRLWADRR